MSNDKMREEFEVWSADHDYLGGCLVDMDSGGEYFDADMQTAWESWKASRENIEIKLPAPDGVNMYGTAVLEINDVRKTIDSYGLKVKK